MSIDDRIAFINANIDSWLSGLREVVQQVAEDAS